MIDRLVKSAFQTGCLSVESEGLIRQLLTLKTHSLQDLTALETLYNAVCLGQVQREAPASVDALRPDYTTTIPSASLGI